MHKCWGNAIEFNEAADKMGVDVMRWMFCSHKPEKDLLFGYHAADEVRRQFLIPLWNVYSFFVTYAGNRRLGTGRKPARRVWPAGPLDPIALNQVIQEVTGRLEGYEPNMATAAVNQFIDDLSNWYLRRSRRRFWARAGSARPPTRTKRGLHHPVQRPGDPDPSARPLRALRHRGHLSEPGSRR